MSKDTSISTDAFHNAASIITKAFDFMFNTSSTIHPATSSTNNNNNVSLQPKSFFLSWNGVLCLIFRGFPIAIEQFKDHLNQTCDNSGYPKENFGSQWAKVTLAYVREDAPPLSLEEFCRLKQICIECSRAFTQECLIPIHTVSLVEYEWRSLEKIHRVKHFDVPSIMTNNDVSGVPNKQHAKTNKVLSEWDDETTYLTNFNAKGAPYRQTLPSNGLTCVAFLDVQSVSVIKQAVSKLRGMLDEEFKDRYVWLEEDSLHCTIRAMDR